MKHPFRKVLAAGCALFAFTTLAAETVWLDEMDLSHMRQGYSTPQVKRSIREKPLTIGGKTFERGVGTHAISTLWVSLDGNASRFSGLVGLDDAANGPGSVAFRIVGDGKELFRSEVMKPGMAAKPVDLDLKGIRSLLLQVQDGGDGTTFDHADWADCRFEYSGEKPQTSSAPKEEPFILTPAPGPGPRINGPTIYGCRPDHPFLYRIPAQGQRPMEFSASKLPASLKLDPATGIITGKAPRAGEYKVTLKAKNAHGKATRLFRIVSGETLALTPPMGWNHWYAHYGRITDQMMREAADIMISSGMADVGYQYVNVDDCWENAPKNNDPLRVGPARDANGVVLANKYFPDMKAMADYIHGKGLKAGLYSSPGPLTCAGYTGSFQHEAQDARTYAEWGFDFLKYDWCSYGRLMAAEPGSTNFPTWGKGEKTLEAYQHPYGLMGNLLKQQNRDIVFNLCQYGMGNVWEWGAKVGGHCWRTAGDLGYELDRIFEVALKNSQHREWSRPGSWNDPDYIQIGWIGPARGLREPQPCPLTPNEQYSFVSLWALMASPLFYSGDMTRLDPFTLNVLCNPEVIDVDQDPLGQSAAVHELSAETFIMVKDLEDQTKAVGLFNRGEFPAEVRASFALIGCSGKQPIRDLWRQKDLGKFGEAFTTRLPRHGCRLLKVGKGKS